MRNPVITLIGIQTVLIAALLGAQIYTADRLYTLERQYEPPDDRILSAVDEKLRCMAITLKWIKRNTEDAERSLSKLAYPQLPNLGLLKRTPPSPC
jgi:hypothetical protein